MSSARIEIAASILNADLGALREAVQAVSAKLGRPLKFLVGKPGLDGHSNGAEQIAARARDCGMEIHYEGIRLTPAEIIAAAHAQNPHVIGLSILSGSHLPLVREVLGLIIGGLTNKEIARSTSLSIATVETHRKAIAQKLGMSGSELVRHASLLGNVHQREI